MYDLFDKLIMYSLIVCAVNGGRSGSLEVNFQILIGMRARGGVNNSL
jgi:hypothetical protein